ncbi:hypothetical protein ACFL2R_03270, partial [Patescibacteria group bacterium]
CFDGIKNQNEEKVDCGGVCEVCAKEIVAEDVEILSKDAVYGGEGLYDVLIKIKNPNSKYGSGDLKYVIYLRDSDGNNIAERSGSGYILPRETKYILETNLESSINPSQIYIELEENNWKETEVFEEPELNIYNKRYSSENGKSVVTGLLRNESDFDFDSVTLDIIVRDESGKPIALNKTEMRTLLSREERDFGPPWPYEIRGNVREIEVRAETNVFDPHNFTRSSTTDGRFQEY